METEFIYWRHDTPLGVRVEEVTGAEDKSGEIWRQLAKQIYCEYGRDGFRQIEYAPCGAPLLEGEPYRISITHTGHLLAVASLPKTPEVNLEEFSPRTAMGIDAEAADREQVMKLRERYLSPEELALIPADDLEANLIAWTAKEALYKAAMTPGLDFRADIIITKLPTLAPDLDPKRAPACFGSATLHLPPTHLRTEDHFPMDLYSYLSEGYIITIAASPKCSKYKH